MGIRYSRTEMQALLSLEGVVGIKFALLSDFEQYEDFLEMISLSFPDVAVFTGEDRMFAESLEKAMDLALVHPEGRMLKMNALVGLGSCLPWLQLFMLRSFDDPGLVADYKKVRALISALARACFARPRLDGVSPDYSRPMEPYIANVGVAATCQFDLPKDSVPDIALVEQERRRRSIPENIVSALGSCNAWLDARHGEKIISLVKKGLELQDSLKARFANLQGVSR